MAKPEKRVVLISLYDEYCLGLRALAAYLTREGFDTFILHFKRHTVMPRESATQDIGTGFLTSVTPVGELYLCYPTPYSDKEMKLLYDLVAELNPLFIGVSVPSYYKETASNITNMLKEGLGRTILWGGAHAILAPEDCLNRGADFVCIGEGEEAVLEFTQLLYEGENPATIDIPNIWRRQNDEIIKTPAPPPIDDLDSLPFPLYDQEREFMINQDRIIHKEPLQDSQLFWFYKLFSSRGCPFNCSFCIYSVLNKRDTTWRRVRQRSVESVLEEIKRYRRRQPQIMMIEFEDDVFTLRKQWMEEFTERYPREVGLPFWCYTHPRTCHAETMQQLKHAGIEYITMGIESGSDRINIEIFDRNVRRDESLRATEVIHESGIPPNYDVITNNPFETEHDRHLTLELLASIPGEFNLHLAKLAVFPGTTLWQRAQQQKTLLEVNEKEYRFWNALYLLSMFEPKSKSSLLELSKNADLKQTPEPLWDLLLTLARQRETIKEISAQSKEQRELVQGRESAESKHSPLKQGGLKKAVKRVLSKWMRKRQ